jgi:hypothetical protein
MKIICGFVKLTLEGPFVLDVKIEIFFGTMSGLISEKRIHYVPQYLIEDSIWEL